MPVVNHFRIARVAKCADTRRFVVEHSTFATAVFPTLAQDFHPHAILPGDLGDADAATDTHTTEPTPIEKSTP